MTPAHVKVISLILTQFYHIYPTIQYQQISVHPYFEKVFDRSVYTSQIFLNASAIHNAHL